MKEFLNFCTTFKRKIEKKSPEIIVWMNKSQTQLHKGFRLNVKNTIENEQDTYRKSQ